MDSTINPSTRANALNSIFQQIKGNHPDSAFYLAKLHVDYSKNNGLDTLLFQKRRFSINREKNRFFDPRWVPRSTQDGFKIALTRS